MKAILFIFGFLGAVGVATFVEPLPVYGLVFTLSIFCVRRRVLLCMFCVGILLGVLRTELFEEQMKTPWSEGERVSIEGRVADVRVFDFDQRVSFRVGAQVVTADLSKYEDFELGQRWQLEGRFTALEPGFEWSRRAVGRLEPFRHVLAAPADPWAHFLNLWRGLVRDRVNSMTSPPTSSLVLGLVLGSRETFSEELSNSFRLSGLMHLVAISGYNIRLLVSIFFVLLGVFSFRYRVTLTLVFILIFTLLVGGGAAVWRASLMGILSLMVTVAGYRRHAYLALLWSGFFMVMMNPYALVYDLGLQLSFLSTWGLMALSPFFDRHLQKVPALFRESLSLTLSSQISTFAILVNAFGTVSLVSIFANLAVAPFLPFAFFASLLALFLGAPAALVADFFIQIIVMIARFFSGLSWAQVEVHFSSFDWISLFVVAGLLFWKLYKPKLDRAFGFQIEAEP